MNALAILRDKLRPARYTRAWVTPDEEYCLGMARVADHLSAVSIACLMEECEDGSEADVRTPEAS